MTHLRSRYPTAVAAVAHLLRNGLGADVASVAKAAVHPAGGFVFFVSNADAVRLVDAGVAAPDTDPPVLTLTNT